jgi:hypothetical protein
MIIANEFPSKFIPNQYIRQAVRKYIQQCPICQKNDERTAPSHGERFVTSSLLLFFTVQIDHLGPFPMDKLGKQHVCGIICTFSDYFDATPVPSVDALSTAYALLHFMARYGTPAQIIIDQGPAFMSQLFEALVQFSGNSHYATIPYSKQGNTRIERTQKEQVRHIRSLVQELAIDEHWSMAVPLALTASLECY